MNTEIQKTKDYTKFKILDANRTIDSAHVDALSNSISKSNLLEANPIIVNKEFEVLDGQHRLRACEKLGIEVPYIVLPEGKVYQDIIRLNTVSKKWNVEDYLKHYLKLDIFEYKVLEAATEKYPLTLGTLIRLMGKGQNTRKQFREGNYRLKDNIKEIYKMLDCLSDFKDIIPLYHRACFVGAFSLVYFCEDYDHEIMLKKFELIGNRFKVLATVEENVKALEELYNYRNSKKVRFY